MKRTAVIVGIWFVAACGPSAGRYHDVDERQLAQPAAAPNSDGIALSLVAHTKAGTEYNPLHHALHTGDRLALWVATPSPRYVYLVNVAPNGDTRLVERAVVDGGKRIPCNGWFALAPPSGQELLAVVVTRVPLDQSGDPMPRIATLLSETQASTRLARIQSRRPPAIDANAGHASMGFRGESLVVDGNAVRSLAEGDEVVVLIDIDHRAPS